MIYAGEDAKFIARRIVVCASEDVGNADPMALNIAVSAFQAVERIGMPESRIILAQACMYVALAPKSNSAIMGIDSAIKYVETHKTGMVPPYLKDAHYKSASKLGRGINYKYPHNFLNHYVDQQYLPDEVVGTKFYDSSGNGYEKAIDEYIEQIKQEETKNINK